MYMYKEKCLRIQLYIGFSLDNTKIVADICEQNVDHLHAYSMNVVLIK